MAQTNTLRNITIIGLGGLAVYLIYKVVSANKKSPTTQPVTPTTIAIKQPKVQITADGRVVYNTGRLSFSFPLFNSNKHEQDAQNSQQAINEQNAASSTETDFSLPSIGERFAQQMTAAFGPKLG